MSIWTAALGTGAGILAFWFVLLSRGYEGPVYRFVFWFGIGGFAMTNLIWERWPHRRALYILVRMASILLLGAAIFLMGVSLMGG